jgi:ATP-dependent Lon protease
MSKKGDNPDRKKSPKKRYNLRKKKNKLRKKQYKLAEESDSDSDWLPEEAVAASLSEESGTEKSSSEESGTEEGGEEAFDAREFQRFVQKIFPSKSGQERLRQLDNIDKMMAKRSKSDPTLKKGKNLKLKTNNKKSQKKKRVRKQSKKKKKKNAPGKEPDEDYDSGELTNAEMDALAKEEASIFMEGEDEYDEEEMKAMMGENTKFNIIFTIGAPPGLGQEEEEDEEEEDSGSEEEDEPTTIDLGKRLVEGQRVEVEKKNWDGPYKGTVVNNSTILGSRIVYDIQLDDEEFEIIYGVRSKYIKVIDDEDEDVERTLKEMQQIATLRKKKGDKSAMALYDKYARAADKQKKKKNAEKEKKQRVKNCGKLRKALREKNVMNDFKYFRDMPIKNQQLILRELHSVNKYSQVEKPYRLALLESEIPVSFKAAALKKINTLDYMDPGSGEYYKIKQWVDTFMRIPFGKINKLPLKLEDGIDKSSEFMAWARKTLDEAVYGLDDAKLQILQFIGQLISNPDSVGSAIAIKGPPGTGKTSLIKEGISKILKRPFAFLALGGATDSSFLEGHSYTYEGSTWGKVVDILLTSKCMNPLIYFDELDKISDTPKGEEITGILTHLTDTTQNSEFHDKYFSNVAFDLSKALFIFSYNDEKKVNPVLKDRMYRIQTNGYTSKEKVVIARDYLIPKIRENIRFAEGDVIIPELTLTHLMENFTEGEKGVRNLKRCLEIIYTKLNLYRLTKPGMKMFEKKDTLKVSFPFTVTVEHVPKLIKKLDDNNIPFGMYA